MSKIAIDIQGLFSADEMKGLAFNIGINPGDFGGDTEPELARELVMAANRRGKLERLLAEIDKERPQHGTIQF